jgi:hypothetical protein
MEDTDKTLENITTSNMCGNHKSLYGDGQQYHQYNKKVESVTSGINFNYSIPFSIFHNTTKRKELFSLKGPTFVYVLSSDWWIIGLTPTIKWQIRGNNNVGVYNEHVLWILIKHRISILILLFCEANLSHWKYALKLGSNQLCFC